MSGTIIGSQGTTYTAHEYAVMKAHCKGCKACRAVGGFCLEAQRMARAVHWRDTSLPAARIYAHYFGPKEEV